MRKGISAGALIACLMPAGAQAQEAIGVISVYQTNPESDPEMIRASRLAKAPNWNVPGNYPPTALAERRGGIVSLELAIGADDRVTDCRIVGTPVGGEDILHAACALVSSQGAFLHALDAEGKARPGRVRLEVFFSIRASNPSLVPPPAPPAPPYEVPGRQAVPADRGQLVLHGVPAGATNLNPVIRADISADGKVTRCRIAKSSGTDGIDLLLCRHLAKVDFVVGRDRGGNPVASKNILVQLVIAQ